MYGAILGDIIGSPYERGGAPPTKRFPLFIPESRFTDDTVMTIAIADALINNDVCSEKTIKNISLNVRENYSIIDNKDNQVLKLEK